MGIHSFVSFPACRLGFFKGPLSRKPLQLLSNPTFRFFRFCLVCSLDFFKSPVQKMVPCGNLFEVRPPAANWLPCQAVQPCCRTASSAVFQLPAPGHPLTAAAALSTAPRLSFHSLHRLRPKRRTWRLPQAASAAPVTKFSLLVSTPHRLWPRRCTWRCPPTALWAPMARPAKRPRPASPAARVRERLPYCSVCRW